MAKTLISQVRNFLPSTERSEKAGFVQFENEATEMTNISNGSARTETHTDEEKVEKISAWQAGWNVTNAIQVIKYD